jgi:hypothetical protein
MEVLGTPFDFLKDVRSRGGPDEGFRICIMMGDVFFDCTSKFCDAAEGPAAKAVHREVPEEALYHIKPGSACWGKMEVEAGIALLPRFDFLRFVRGVVVTGDADFFVGRCAPFDQVKEAQPFLMPVLIHACANDAAVGCVHCCKQGGRAVTFVIVESWFGSVLSSEEGPVGCDPVPGFDPSRHKTKR